MPDARSTAYADFLRRADASPEPRHEFLEADGRRVVYERTPAPGIVATMTTHAPDGAEQTRVTEFAAASERPPTYPAALPFLPGRPVAVTAMSGGAGHVVTWGDVADPDALVAALDAGLRADGWERHDPEVGAMRQLAAFAARSVLAAVLDTRLVHRRYERDGCRRMVLVTARGDRPGLVSLTDGTAAASTTSA